MSPTFSDFGSSFDYSSDSDGNASPVVERRVTRASGGIYKPNPRYALLIVANDIPIPCSPCLFLIDPAWKEVMEAEIAAFHWNNTWTLVPRSARDNIINSKWVVKAKPKSNGTIERYKAASLLMRCGKSRRATTMRPSVRL